MVMGFTFVDAKPLRMQNALCTVFLQKLKYRVAKNYRFQTVDNVEDQCRSLNYGR